MMTRLHLKNFAALFCLILAFTTNAYAAPDFATAPVTGKKGGKVVVVLEANPKTFNPHLIEDAGTRKTLAGYVFIGLNSYNHATGQIENELAKSVTVSPDAKTYTYKIRQGLQWPDGAAFTVDDVIFSWQAFIDPQTISNNKDAMIQSDGTLPQIRKVDDETVEFKLAEANVLFEDDLTNFQVIPKHKWENALKNQQFMNTLLTNANPEDVFGMGPFILKKYVPDQVLIFERNPHYYKRDQNGVQLPYLDKVVRLITPDFEASFVKVRNQEIDMYELQATQYDLLKRESEKLGITVMNPGAGFDVTYYNFNLNPRKNADGKPYVDPDKLKIFADKRFRQALNYATDRDSIIKVAYLGLATPIYTFDSPSNTYWYKTDVKTYPFDLEKAKALLDEMGLKDLDGDGFRDVAPGKKFEFTIKTNVENKIRVSIVNLLKNDFAKIGIAANINPVPFNSLINNLHNDYDFEAVALGWGSSVPPDPLGSKNIILSHSSSHNWNASSPTPAYDWEKRMNEIVYAMSAQPDRQVRQKLWFELTDLWQEELPQTMIVAPNPLIAIKSTLKNVKPSTLRPYFDWNIEEIYDDAVTQ